jgi:hypothetical protein
VRGDPIRLPPDPKRTVQSPTRQREIERTPERVQSLAGRDRKGPEIER